jgi:hypothetical protein
MKIYKTMYALFFIVLLLSCASAENQSSQFPQDTPMVRDDWPRQIVAGAVTFSISQPQVETWEGNKLTARSAVGVQAAGEQKQRYGVVWFTARTEVNKDTRMVLLQDFAVMKINFQGIADKGQSYQAGLMTSLPNHPVQIALDRLEASLEVSGSAGAKKFVQVKNTPPRIIFEDRLSVLVLVDGKPVLRAIQGSEFKQVINTGVLLLADAAGSPYYLWLFDRWVQAASLDGLWSAVKTSVPESLNAAKKYIAEAKKADLLENIGPEVKQALLQGRLPVMYVSTVPARLIQTSGEPQLEDIPGTALRYAANTNDIILFDMTGLRYYILIDGRWYRSISRKGPWTYVDGKELPPDFAKIPAGTPAGRALYAVPGTVQARQAVVEATTPHTQTISKSTTATATYDGQPQFNPIEGTPLRYAVNASLPVIRIDEKTYYMVYNGVWFSSTSPQGPWVVAASVPQIIYTIPANSPVHYVTYVYVYGATPTAVYTGYTAGYNGVVVTPASTVVYSTGYIYPGWAGAYWYPPYNYYYYDDDYYKIHTTYDGKYVERGYSDYGTFTKVGDTTFARTEDGHYATRDGNLYKRELGGWKEYDPDSGDWNLSNYSKVKDIKKIQDHRQGDGTDTDRTPRGSSSGTGQTSGADSQSRFGNREGTGTGDNSRELEDSYRARTEGERRVSVPASRGAGPGFGGGGFGGGGFRGRR